MSPTSFLGWCLLLTRLVSAAYVYPNGSRLNQIRSMYAWEGFVYDIEPCKTTDEMAADFTHMKSRGARTVITFDFCGTGADASYYDDIILAAERAGIFIIPLAWTLPIHVINQNYTANDTFLIKSVPRILAVTEAVMRNPGPVLAVAVGDEPLYDDDAGSPDALAYYINNMRSNFTAAGLDIPISISELAYGWQISGNITAVSDSVDFFMINEFPYFAQNAQAGGSNSSWQNLLTDMEYFETLASGRPLLITQTGWPSNEEEFAPNSPAVVASVASEEAYWKLLDRHCEDYFKAKNIGWMWRAYSDVIEGWGVIELNGTGQMAVECVPFLLRLDPARVVSLADVNNEVPFSEAGWMNGGQIDEGSFPQRIYIVFVAHPQDAGNDAISCWSWEGLEESADGGESAAPNDRDTVGIPKAIRCLRKYAELYVRVGIATEELRW